MGATEKQTKNWKIYKDWEKKYASIILFSIAFIMLEMTFSDEHNLLPDVFLIVYKRLVGWAEKKTYTQKTLCNHVNQSFTFDTFDIQKDFFVCRCRCFGKLTFYRENDLTW